MDYKIKQSLEKYWAGESSLEEEKQLKKYFQQESIASDLEPYRQLFNYFTGQENISMRSELNSFTNEPRIDERSSKKRFRIPMFVWRSAAAIALIAGCFLSYQQVVETKSDTIVWEDTYDDPKEAYAKTKEILSLVSRKMKNGTEKAAYSVNKAQTATNMIRE